MVLCSTNITTSNNSYNYSDIYNYCSIHTSIHQYYRTIPNFFAWLSAVDALILFTYTIALVHAIN